MYLQPYLVLNNLSVTVPSLTCSQSDTLSKYVQLDHGDGCLVVFKMVVVLARAIYSASAVDSATEDCFYFSSSQHLHME